MAGRLAFVMSVFASMLATGAQAGAQQIPKDDPLYIRLAAHPSPERAAIVHGGDRNRTGYEVYVANFGTTPMKITKVGTEGRNHRTLVLQQETTGRSLTALFRSASGKPAADQQPMLSPGESAVLFLFPTLNGDRMPTEIETSITIQGEGEHGGSGTIHLAPLAVSGERAVVISSPVHGSRWLAGNAPSNTSAHRRAILLFGGKPKIGQRYAIDWVQLGDDGRTFHGDEHDNRNYYAYDQDVHAAADGLIVRIKDGIPENTPNSGKNAIPINQETVAGNHIIEDLGGGRFVAYAHLRPGTIKVKVGERIRVGEVIAHLGNTGNSSEPHLHFQVCDAPSFVDSEGLPFAIERFARDDYEIGKHPAGKQKLTVHRARQVSNQEPLENELDSFDSK